jgi:uncharacterized membrane protein/glutaredoxin
VFGQPLSLFGWLAYGVVLLLAVLPLVVRGDSRAALAQRSWWGLLLLSTGMAVFSLLLMGVMVLKIQAFCFFCVLSATLSLSLFVISLVGGEWEDRGQLVFRAVIVALLVGMVGLGWAASVDRPAAVRGAGVPPLVVATSSPEAIALAEHLSRTGAVMYTAYWCPHCREQKELFGKEGAAALKIVECAPDGYKNQAALCEKKQIKGFPSWEINGTVDSGVKPLAKLAAMSNYSGPNGF